MIVIENIAVSGLEAAIRGMRNPMNSWDKSDSYSINHDEYSGIMEGSFRFGEADKELAYKLAEAALEAGHYSHSKWRRFVVVSMDIIAPLYWWKEMDTYKVSTVSNSCSTMHKICSKEFELKDFSRDHLTGFSKTYLEKTIEYLNELRDLYNNWGLYSEDERNALKKAYPNGPKDIWWQIIQLLPSSYNQKRTWMANYEVISNILHQRRLHKLDEWQEFCKEMDNELPYSDMLI